MGRSCGLISLALFLAACDGGDGDGPATVEPEDLTRAAVERDVAELVTTRLVEAVGAEVVRRVQLLCWEVRSIPERQAPSDLVLVFAEYLEDGAEGFLLGQAFRHREGSSVHWQWYVVRDPAWLEFRLFRARPTPSEVEAFLVHWDFEREGKNGTLVAGLCDESAWEQALGRPAPTYPASAPAPDAL